MANRTAILAVRIVSDAKKGVQGLQQTTSAAERMEKRTRKASAVAAVGLAVLAKAGMSAAKAAAEDAQGQAVLAKAMQNATGATKSQVAATEAFIDKTARATGVADDQLRPAMANLVRGSRDVGQAQKDLALALDVAAATGKPVEAVSKAIAKGYSGQTTALGRLVPGMDKALLKSGDMSKVTAELARLTGGSAAAAAETAQGKYQRLMLRLDELQETIGAALIPVLDRVVAVLSTVGTWVENNTGKATALAAALTVLAVGVIAVNLAFRAYILVQKAMIVGQIAFNAVMAVNPIVWVVLAVVALTAGLVLLYKRSERVRAIVQAVGRVGQTALGWIIDKARALGAFLVGQLGGKFRMVQAIARLFGTGARTAIGWVVDRARDVWQWFANIGAKIGVARDAVVRGFDRMLSPVQAVLNAVKDVVSWVGRIKFPSVPSAIKNLAGKVGLSSVAGPSAPTGVAGPVVVQRSRAVPSVMNVIRVEGVVDAPNFMRTLRRQGVRLGSSTVVVMPA